MPRSILYPMNTTQTSSSSNVSSRRVAVIGSGAMGSGLARLFADSGHVVTLGSRDPAVASARLADLPVVDPAAAVRDAEIVFLAVPFVEAAALSGLVGTLEGRVVVDLTNPLTPDYMGLTVGFIDSAGETVARAFPGAKVVKAFNTVFAGVLGDALKGERNLPSVLVAGDDDEAKALVIELACGAGFSAYDTGALTNARYLEPMAELQIQLAYGRGHGARIGFVLRTAV